MLKKLGIFDLVSYDDNNESHRNFKKQILRDDDFKKYFGEFF